MNPQQFQNMGGMGGMGRGMPQNMQQMAMSGQIPGQMPGQMGRQMGGQMGGQMAQMNPMAGQMGAGMARPMPQQMGGQLNLGHPQIQHYIFENLRNQGPFTGWQEGMRLQERAGQIKLLVDSLRLVRPPVELLRAIEVALKFERKHFTQAASKEDYFRDCNEKLGQIRDQRTQQMSQIGGGGMQGMQMPTQNFMPQMQANQQMPNNMSLPPHLQQMQQQQQDLRNSPMFNQARPVMNQAQPSATPNPGMAGMMPGNNQSLQSMGEMTPEDNKAINLRAAELAKGTSKEEMKILVERMNPSLRQSLNQKSVDPIIYYFRMLATKEFKERKAKAMGAAMGQNNGGANGMGSLPNQATQNQLNQGMTVNGNPMMASMDRFMGQQADGLRSQETGELVVPASTTQGILPEQMRLQQQMLAQQRMGQQNQANNMNPAFIAQQQQAQGLQQAQRLQQVQASRMQQAQLQQQNQAQAQARATQAQAAQAQAQMAGRQGQMPAAAGSSTPLSAINRPVNPSVSGVDPQAISRPTSETQMMGQQMQAAGGPRNQNQSQGLSQQQQIQREQMLAQLPAKLQAILRQKPQSEWRNIIEQFQQHQQNGQMKRTSSQQTPAMQSQQSQGQPGPGGQMQNGAFIGGANIGAMPMQQSLSTGAMSQQGQDMSTMPPGQQPMNQQEMMRQRQMQMQMQRQQQQQQQAQAGQANMLGQAQPRQPLSAQHMSVMDKQAVPPTILGKIRQKTPLPDIKTWYDLKQWLQVNPIEDWTVSHIMDIQATHFQHLMNNKQKQQMMLQQQQKQNNQPNAQMSTMMPQQRLQGPMPGGPGQAPTGAATGQMSFRPPNAADIEKVRATNPTLAGVPDEQIKMMLINRQRQLAEKMRQQGMSQQMPSAPPQASQANKPGQSMAFPMPMQGQPANNMLTPQPTRPPSGQMTGQSRPPQVPFQPENKALKRPSDDDLVALPNQTSQAQQAKPATRPQGIPTLTKEQFNALDPAKKAQYINMQKQQQAQQALIRKVFELTKEVQAGAPKLRPITNMSAENKKRMTDLLTSVNVKNMLGRFESLLIAFFRINNDEAAVKQLALQRYQLQSQYKPSQNKTYEPLDTFSITADNAEAIVNNVTAKFQQTMAHIPNNKGRPQQAQLTPENLSLLDAQEKERKQSLKGNQAPPAPTSSQPPFQFGDPRGQGTPRYATPGLKQEDLKLPTDPKRRKKNQQQTSAPTPATPASPQASKTSKAADTFRCTVGGCENQLKGFSSQAELDQHHTVAHKLDMEPVTDPLTFLHESLRSAFNLDENLKQIKKPKIEAKVGATSNIKKENSVATPVAMAKIPSQGGASQQDTDVQMKDEDDAWSHSNITLDQLRTVFGGDGWEDLFPSEEKLFESQNQFYQAYRDTSPRWRKIVEGPNGALTDTSTEKSKSPEGVSDKESLGANASGSEKKENKTTSSEDEPWKIDLNGIEGLDLGGLDDWSPFENIDGTDVVMGENGSPFETVEKTLSTEELHFQAMGGDLANPQNWTAEQKSLAEFLFDS